MLISMPKLVIENVLEYSSVFESSNILYNNTNNYFKMHALQLASNLYFHVLMCKNVSV